MSKRKVTIEERIEAAKVCTEGRMSRAEAARRLGVDKSMVIEWVSRYKAQGELGFREQEHPTVYSAELKTSAVKEYISGVGSQREIAAKYGLRSKSTLKVWIKWYNSGKDFGRKR